MKKMFGPAPAAAGCFTPKFDVNSNSLSLSLSRSLSLSLSLSLIYRRKLSKQGVLPQRLILGDKSARITALFPILTRLFFGKTPENPKHGCFVQSGFFIPPIREYLSQQTDTASGGVGKKEKQLCLPN
jgi:hypothetical protein